MIKVVIVGAGSRGDAYARLALSKPEKMQVVGVVEPDLVRNEIIKERYSIPEENCFTNLEDFLARDKFADAVINGTMDDIHVETSVPIMEKGYDLLLEKPFCIKEEDIDVLLDAKKRTGRQVMICHVLRYTPFYKAIKKHLLAGDIGDILSIQQTEHVSYHHYGVSFLRGKWACESVCGSPLLLQKSCHDVDLMMWLKAKKPVAVSSFGADYQFKEGMKTDGAGHFCMIDCPKEVEEACMFSARKNYLEPNRHWRNQAWRCMDGKELEYEACKAQLQKKDNPYARCVWDCEHDVVDNQTVTVMFEDGTTGVFALVGGATAPERNIHIIGTKGEIKGTFDKSKYVIRKASPDNKYEETEYDLNVTGDMTGEYGGHGGGDLRLIEDFVDNLSGIEPSISCTTLEDSVYSHLTVFRAEKARKNGTVERVC